jgi:hypothetical protein
MFALSVVWPAVSILVGASMALLGLSGLIMGPSVRNRCKAVLIALVGGLIVYVGIEGAAWLSANLPY